MYFLFLIKVHLRQLFFTLKYYISKDNYTLISSHITMYVLYAWAATNAVIFLNYYKHIIIISQVFFQFEKIVV